MNRYIKQQIFKGIGKVGQEKLANSTIAIIGLGALGTVVAGNLARAGVGHIKLVDRDFVELSNLQRQVLYTEYDAEESVLKAVAAYKHLSKINSTITLEPVVADVNSLNIENIIKNCSLVLDCSDNLELRLLINECCHKLKIPFVYCGAIGSTGMTANFLMNENDACFKCFLGETKSTGETCATTGVLNMASGAIANIQSAEAIKILVGSNTVQKNLFVLDVWGNDTQTLAIKKDKNCKVCACGVYENLNKMPTKKSTVMCGGGLIQITGATQKTIDFDKMANALKKFGKVNYNIFTLVFKTDVFEITVFSDGRALIKGAIDESNAMSLYNEYVGE